MEYCAYTKLRDGQFMIWNSETNEITNKLLEPHDIHHFELYAKKKDIDKSGLTLEEYLRQYGKNIMTWRNELLNCKSLIKQFDYMDESKGKRLTLIYKTHQLNIMKFFKRYLPKSIDDKVFDIVQLYEYVIYEKTYNGGLQKLLEPGIYKTIGYDFSNSYGNIMSSNLFLCKYQQNFFMPTKKGELYKYDTMPEYFEYGLYNIKIESTSEYFDMIFVTNVNNWYTHYELNFLLSNEEELKCSMKLITDNEYNALIYRKKTLIDGFKIFNQWNMRLQEVKNELPNNGLVKMLRSRLWVFLSERNSKTYTEQEIINENIECDINLESAYRYLLVNEVRKRNGEMVYELLDKEQPYRYNYRLKPFITSFQRVVIAQIGMQHIKAIVRIHTDAITYDIKKLKDHYDIDIEAGDILHKSEDLPTFKIEDKTTGKIEFKNINVYEKVK
jgi:hypothetical protein